MDDREAVPVPPIPKKWQGSSRQFAARQMLAKKPLAPSTSASWKSSAGFRTPVSLKFRDKPLSEVLEQFGQTVGGEPAPRSTRPVRKRVLSPATTPVHDRTLTQEGELRSKRLRAET